MYAPDASVFVTEERPPPGCAGAASRHFRVFARWWPSSSNPAQPHVAVFGQKDYQQAAIIRRMVRDLNFPIEIVVAPIVREPDGLAMSSRNVYLSADERQRALGLSRALQAAAACVEQGGAPAADVRARMVEVIEAHALQLDYAEIVDAESLEPVAEARRGNVALVAAQCGRTRLIDNQIL